MTFNNKSLLLKNDRIYLRPLDIIDITDEYVAGLNDPEVNRYLLNVRLNIQTKESVEAFVRSNMDDASSILLGIFVKDDPEPFIGTLRVSGIDLFHYLASVGICVFAKRAWKKGYALQSITLVKEYLFESLGLHYLEAGVYAENANAVTLFNNAGFSESYRMKDKFRHIDSFEEGISFAAVNQSFDMALLSRNYSPDQEK